MASATEVTAALARYGLYREAAWGPYGYSLGMLSEGGWRIARMGGIAGRSHVWRIVKVDGSYASWEARTVAQVCRLLREWLAGFDERPADRAGYITYAKLNHNRFGDHWVWVQRRCKRRR